MTSNESILSMLLAVCVCIISFLIWKISIVFAKSHVGGFPNGQEDFALLSAVIEQERTRISTELHDELGTLLSIIYLDLELVTHEASSLTPYGENRLREIKRNLNLVIESIRTNIWNLSGQMFSEVDLAFAIRELCHKLDRHKGTHVVFVQSGVALQLRDNYKLHLFRITQELLTNAIKHSSAWNITVYLHWEKNALSIVIEDDGVSYNATKGVEGQGILNISKRAEYIGATVSKETLPKGQRTIIFVKVP